MLAISSLFKFGTLILIFMLALSTSIRNTPRLNQTSALYALRTTGYGSTSDLILRKNYVSKKKEEVFKTIKENVEKIPKKQLTLLSQIVANGTLLFPISDYEKLSKLETNIFFKELLKRALQKEFKQLSEYHSLHQTYNLELDKIESTLKIILDHPEVTTTPITPILGKPFNDFFINLNKSLTQTTLTRPDEKKNESIYLPFPRRNMDLPTSGPISKLSGAPFHEGGVSWEGIIIKNNAGASVRAVGAGEIVFAADFSNLKNLIILDHGEGYLTLYGNLKHLLVSTGMSVSDKQELGIAPDVTSDSPKGLYFEIRKNGEPVNPKIWFDY